MQSEGGKKMSSKMPSMYKHSKEMFVTSLHYFRSVMCSTKYTLRQKDGTFASLCQDYLRCELPQNLKTAFVAVMEEWSRRRGYEDQYEYSFEEVMEDIVTGKV